MDQPITLKVNTPKGPGGSIEVIPSETTVQDLEDRVREVLKYSETDYFVMVLAGKKLSDPDTKLSEYKVRHNGAVIVAKMNRPPSKPVLEEPKAVANEPVHSLQSIAASPQESPKPSSASSPTPAPIQTSIPVSSTTTTSSPPVSTSTSTVGSSPVPALTQGNVGAESSSESEILSQISTLANANIPQLLDRDVFVSFIQTLNESHPELAKELMSNPELFIETVATVAFGSSALLPQQIAATGGSGGAGAPNGVFHNPERDLESQLTTEEEKQSIQRLQELGFSRSKAIQAFLLCDRNENLAANYLFDTMKDF